jgi:hypothetical protein
MVVNVYYAHDHQRRFDLETCHAERVLICFILLAKQTHGSAAFECRDPLGLRAWPVITSWKVSDPPRRHVDRTKSITVPEYHKGSLAEAQLFHDLLHTVSPV